MPSRRLHHDYLAENPGELALAHDYLIQMGGAERVVASMVRRHPLSLLYTSAVRRESLRLARWPA